MKIDKTKPHEVLKDPEKAAAEHQAKVKRFGEAVLFFTVMGFIIWWNKSPSTFKQTLHYLKDLLT